MNVRSLCAASPLDRCHGVGCRCVARPRLQLSSRLVCACACTSSACPVPALRARCADQSGFVPRSFLTLSLFCVLRHRRPPSALASFLSVLRLLSIGAMAAVAGALHGRGSNSPLASPCSAARSPRARASSRAQTTGGGVQVVRGAQDTDSFTYSYNDAPDTVVSATFIGCTISSNTAAVSDAALTAPRASACACGCIFEQPLPQIRSELARTCICIQVSVTLTRTRIRTLRGHVHARKPVCLHLHTVCTCTLCAWTHRAVQCTCRHVHGVMLYMLHGVHVKCACACTCCTCGR